MKTKEEALAHLESSIGYIPDRYRSGVGRADWATPAASDVAEKNFADAMSRAIAAKTRQSAVKKVSNADWQARASEKGGAVIGERIRGALGKWMANFGAVYDRVTADVGRLPPKTVDFRSNISNRLVPTVESWKKHSGKL